MPSEGYYYLSDTDLGAIIAYVKSVPPVDHEISERVVTSSLARVLVSAGAFGKVFSAEDIDHAGPRPTAAAPGVTATYGDYLVRVGECRTCHGANLDGGKDPNPQAPPAPNLTQGGELRAWSDEDFIRTLHTGETPGGHQLSEFMPWKYLGQMTDDELRSVWLYLKSLPPITSR
jgi:mono/diheme cytochrome c family protein